MNEVGAPGRCIAMWSGPRNISTAMMRAWENRADTIVIDEPFYAHYLEETGIQHPMAREIIAAGETDWHRVVRQITTSPSTGVFYQKHITTHWMPYFDTDWLDKLDHVFLIRDPNAVAASYSNKWQDLSARDLGYAQQHMLFELIKDMLEKEPLVIDSARFLQDPASQLRSLCNTLDLNFDKSMLSWPAGKRSSDGLWEAHWYDSVRESTGFVNASHKPAPVLTIDLQGIAGKCMPHYEALLRCAI
ncbi:MAG: hypothetical protein V3U76_03125 [Granulosicoccus sp.]